jgi:hypothetical protein
MTVPGLVRTTAIRSKVSLLTECSLEGERAVWTFIYLPKRSALYASVMGEILMSHKNCRTYGLLTDQLGRFANISLASRRMSAEIENRHKP